MEVTPYGKNIMKLLLMKNTFQCKNRVVVKFLYILCDSSVEAQDRLLASQIV